MEEFSSRVKSGEFWKNHINATVYLDSSKGMPLYSFSRDDLTVVEQLTESELKEYISKISESEGNLFYPASAAPNVPYTREEAIEYYKNALFKIKYKFTLYVPKEKVGFYTVYAKHS